ncbi:unnamed protein product [Malus baccata var. baccata]
MGFVVTTLIFAMVGVIASLMVRICCGRGASANLYVLFALLASPYTCYHSGSVLLDDVCHRLLPLIFFRWAIVYLAQMKPLIVPILTEGE